MSPLYLYAYAEERGIDVDWYSMESVESLSIRLSSGKCAVAVDPWKLRTVSDENVKIAHELGHCETGSFYNLYSPFDVQQKHENRADRWAIKKLVPKDELDKAVKQGNTELWELAELFDITEDFMRKAVEYYKSTEM